MYFFLYKVNIDYIHIAPFYLEKLSFHGVYQITSKVLVINFYTGQAEPLWLWFSASNSQPLHPPHIGNPGIFILQIYSK